MATLSKTEIMDLLLPYLGEQTQPVELIGGLSIYLDLLMKWNTKTNLTAIRDPKGIVTRHFGESLFAGLHLPRVATLLDFGSGAGFPGLPIQLLRPSLRVTLAESQNKKATFLREVVRSLGLQTEVWGGRVEAMPADRRFDIVSLRAVDDMAAAVVAASDRVLPGGHLAVLTSGAEGMKIPGSQNIVLQFIQR